MCRHETHLEWNIVPFSKYPSWCTSMMSPYFDFRWQRKGLCRTSMFTSASGSVPPLTDSSSSSRQEQSQLSTVNSMLPRSRNEENKQQGKQPHSRGGEMNKKVQHIWRSSNKACRWSSTWQGSDVVQTRVVAGSFLVIGWFFSCKPRPQALPLASTIVTSVGLIFISVQRFLTCTVMQKDYWLVIF